MLEIHNNYLGRIRDHIWKTGQRMKFFVEEKGKYGYFDVIKNCDGKQLIFYFYDDANVKKTYAMSYHGVVLHT